MKISGRKSILSETNKVTNIKQKSGKHEVYTDLDIYDENGKLKTELLPTVSVGGDYDRLPLDYAIQQLFQELIRTDNFWTYFLSMWNTKLLYDEAGEVILADSGEVVYV